jgi:hypothetical protein
LIRLDAFDQMFGTHRQGMRKLLGQRFHSRHGNQTLPRFHACCRFGRLPGNAFLQGYQLAAPGGCPTCLAPVRDFLFECRCGGSEILGAGIEAAQFSLARAQPATNAAAFFIQDDAVALLLQLTRACEAGQTGTDDGNMHGVIFLGRLE